MGKRMKSMWMLAVARYRPSPADSEGRPMSPRKRAQKEVASATREATTTSRAGSSRRHHTVATGQRLLPPRLTMMRIMAGPRMTMNIEGKMQPTRGKSILMGALAACSSAR